MQWGERPVEQIGLIVNRKKKGAAKLAQELKTWLKRRGKKVLSDSRGLDPILRKADLIVCFGGDGTILNVAGKLKKSTPVLGVNLGNLGFLTGVQGKEVFQELEAIFDGTCRVEERILMKVNLLSLGRKSKSFQALNDAVINREGLSRYVRIEVRAGGEDLMKFSGDGVIVATPTGSTAYSLSAGGPFVYPTLRSFVVTPLSAHSLLTRPIVMRAADQIEVRFRTEGKGRASLVVDGQIRKVIRPSDSVKITLSPVRLHLVSSSEHSYLETLRGKFGLVESKH